MNYICSVTSDYLNDHKKKLKNLNFSDKLNFEAIFVKIFKTDEEPINKKVNSNCYASVQYCGSKRFINIREVPLMEVPEYSKGCLSPIELPEFVENIQKIKIIILNNFRQIMKEKIYSYPNGLGYLILQRKYQHLENQNNYLGQS